MKRAVKFLWASFGGGVLLGAALLTYFISNNLAPASVAHSGDGVNVTVRPGENVPEIAGELEKKHLIRSARALILYVKLAGTGGSFKTGTYRIRSGETMKAIHDEMIQGKQQLYSVTIPEGWTVLKIGILLEKKHITSAQRFYKAVRDPKILKQYSIPSNTAEGYLYPDTYMLQQNFPAERVVRFFLDSFFRKIGEIYPDYKSLTSDELYRKVIIASIVEREYRIKAEAPLIAGVFYNRLKDNMSLGSCATIAYIITDVEGKKHPSLITYDDLDIDSPYNTYRHKGLPPAPISNPSAVALRAAFYPAHTKYLFFVLENPKTGRHKFTKTYRDHLNAKNFYIKSK